MGEERAHRTERERERANVGERAREREKMTWSDP